jgi:hypothetical protein
VIKDLGKLWVSDWHHVLSLCKGLAKYLQEVLSFTFLKNKSICLQWCFSSDCINPANHTSAWLIFQWVFFLCYVNCFIKTVFEYSVRCDINQTYKCWT